MSRPFNFNAGPAMLPGEVLTKAQNELLDWQGTGLSPMEMSHRSPEFKTIADKAYADIHELLAIPTGYKVLFLPGGATSQFGMVPMNLLQGKSSADYFDTGLWSKKAIKEAERFCQVNIVASSSEQYNTIPPMDSWNLNPDAAYVHYTPNETIGGVEFHSIPDTGDVPLIADMSSNILSRPLDISRFGLIYAGAQKNIGQAGITLVIIKESLIKGSPAGTPSMFDYHIHIENDSMFNTPPTYSWYIAGLVFDWIKRKGGLEAMAELNKNKAEKLYATIDNSDFYENAVDKEYRSWMNVPFSIKQSDLDKQFLTEAKEVGLVGLKGHRLVGGMRASIYNAMPMEGIDALVTFMNDFEKRNG